MIKIRVTAEQLKEIFDCLESRQEPYDAAFRYGFRGFTSGEDHVEIRAWSLIIVDRGCNGRDNTTKFYVPLGDRKGSPPLKP